MNFEYVKVSNREVEPGRKGRNIQTDCKCRVRFTVKEFVQEGRTIGFGLKGRKEGK